MKFVVAFVCLCALVVAEPPPPSSQYLPSNRYGPPSAPSAQYGAPSNQYGPPSNQYGPPSNQYGPPSQTQAVIRPNNQYGAPSPGGNYLPPNGGGGFNGYPGGRGGGYDDESEPANYSFKYDVQDAESGNDFGHEEQRQGDVARGKYYVLLPDGRRQVVEYIADNDGYKPKISYEQVGGGGGYPSGRGNGGYQY